MSDGEFTVKESGTQGLAAYINQLAGDCGPALASLREQPKFAFAPRPCRASVAMNLSDARLQPRRLQSQ